MPTRTLESVNPMNIIPCDNGLLDITDLGGELHLFSHTPRWFNLSCLGFPFDENAKAEKWQTFLVDVFDGDAERIALLQEFIGLCLTPDTSYQKILMMVGPKRSGKGTIMRVLTELLGPDAVCAPTLGSLTDGFGMSQLYAKTVCMFPDASLGHRTDSMKVLEILKSVSGEDRVSVNRKNLPYLTNVRLQVRFIITVNELPRFSDAAGALESRLLLLPFENSYVGREDRQLENKLRAELPGILNFALRGLHRLRTNGVFTATCKATELLSSYRRMTAPTAAFVEDRCTIGADSRVACADLYGAWKEWCSANGHEPGAMATFGEHLRAATPGIRKIRSGTGVRVNCYQGIGLRHSTS
jgi:putative DNA primase/helicase